MTTDFSDWLQNELAVRDMTSADLARITQKDQGIFSRIIRRERKPENATLRAIAKALKIPAAIVFEAAGELPIEDNKKDQWVEEMNHKIKLLPPATRPVAEKLLNALLEEDAKPATNPKKAKA